MRTYAAVTLNSTLHLVPVLNDHENSMRGLKCYRCSDGLAKRLRSLGDYTVKENQFTLDWNWTNDFTKVKIDTKLIDRTGKSYIINGITKNINGKYQFWADGKIISTQAINGSDKAKEIPFFAYEQVAVLPDRLIDKRGVRIGEGATINVLSVGECKVFNFNGELLIAPFGKLERVNAYNSADIEVLEEEFSVSD